MRRSPAGYTRLGDMVADTSPEADMTTDVAPPRRKGRWWVAVVAIVLLGGAAAILVVAQSKQTNSSTGPNQVHVDRGPWCKDPNHPAAVGMYGDLGHVDLVGEKGKLGQFIDLPNEPVTIALFQQGLAQLYGFNNVEALRSFRAALAGSPNCTLCSWGAAVSLAPNINYDIENATLYSATINATAVLAAAQPSLTPKSKLLIKSFQLLGSDIKLTKTSPERKAWVTSLCNRTQILDHDYDVDTFCAGAAMANTAWDYYTTTHQGERGMLKPELADPKARLLRAWNATATPHVFAIHLLIHLLEPTTAPEEFAKQALVPAQTLYNASHGQELVPAQGHLTHMPAHLFLRTGLYAAGVATSKVAVANNRRYAVSCLSPYCYGHNLKMLVAHARLAGMFGDAVTYSREAQSKDAGVIATPANSSADACIDCAGVGSPLLVYTLARAARWRDLLAERVPTDYGTTKFAGYHEAGWYHARALALYGLATPPNASITPNSTLLITQANAAAEHAIRMANKANLSTLFDLSGCIPAELEAVKAWRVERNRSKAIAAYEALVAADDLQQYSEPPSMYFAPRQCLGYALLHAGNATRALASFEDDLSRYLENAWSLYGAADAAKALNLTELAKNYTARADAAWSHADAPFTSPCPQLAL